MTKEWRYGQKGNRRRIQVDLVPNLTGKPAIIKAGAKSLYGKEFPNDTPCTFIKNYDRQAYYFGLRTSDAKIVLIPREYVVSEFLDTGD